MGTPALKLAAVTAIVAFPAAALGATLTYKGDGTYDPRAKIELVVAKHDGKRTVKRITAKKLRYSNGEANCTDSGRTRELTIRGSFRVKRNRFFRARDQIRSGLGELAVTGGFNHGHIEGIMRFIFGKDGCKTERTHYVARPD